MYTKSTTPVQVGLPSKNRYIVMGEAGEPGNKSMWVVGVSDDRALAEATVKVAKELAAAYQASMDRDPVQFAKKWLIAHNLPNFKLNDPGMDQDNAVFTVKEAPAITPDWIKPRVGMDI